MPEKKTSKPNMFADVAQQAKEEQAQILAGATTSAKAAPVEPPRKDAVANVKNIGAVKAFSMRLPYDLYMRLRQELIRRAQNDESVGRLSMTALIVDLLEEALEKAASES